MISLLGFIIALSFLLSQIVRLQLGNGLTLNILDVAVGIISTLGFLWFIYKKRIGLLFKSGIGKGIILFCGTAILSFFVNIASLNLEQFIISGMYIVRWISYAFIFILIFNLSSKSKITIQKIMFLAGIFFVSTGYIQLVYYRELRNLYYLGWDEHMYRMFGTFLDPNFTGIFLVLFLFFLLEKRIKMSIKPITKSKLFLTTIIAFTIGALILTFSRSAFVMLVIALIIFFSLIKEKKWIFAVIGLIFAIGIIFSQRFYIESINPFRTTSSQARLTSMKEGIEIFFQKPILGVGFNAYRYAQVQYGYRKQANIEESHADAGVDNSFLFVLATTGIVGFSAYLFLLFHILKNTYQSPVIFSSVIGLCIASLFTNALFFPPLMLWMWLILGVTKSN